jgi:hypothetical protein
MKKLIDSKLFTYLVPLILWTMTIPFHNSESLFLTTLSTVSMVLMLVLLTVITIATVVAVITIQSALKSWTDETPHSAVVEAVSETDSGYDTLLSYKTVLDAANGAPWAWTAFMRCVWFFGFVAVGWTIPAIIYVVACACYWTLRVQSKQLAKELGEILDGVDSYRADRNKHDPRVAGNDVAANDLLAKSD